MKRILWLAPLLLGACAGAHAPQPEGAPAAAQAPAPIDSSTLLELRRLVLDDEPTYEEWCERVLREAAQPVRRCGFSLRFVPQEHFLRGLKDERREVRSAAAWGLARKWDGEASDDAFNQALPHLEDMAQHDDLDVYYGATKALQAAGGRGVEDGLLPLVRHGRRPTAAAYALMEYYRSATPGPESEQVIEAMLEQLDPEASSSLRSLALEVLGFLGERAREAAPATLALLGDADPDVRQEAARALGRIGCRLPHAIPVLRRRVRGDSSPGVREAAALSLGQLGGAAVIGDLEQALVDPDDGVREAVAEGLGATSSPLALPALRVALADPHTEVRYQACKSLGRIPAAEAQELLEAQLDDPEYLVRLATFDALLARGAEGCAVLLEIAANGEDDDLREEVVRSLVENARDCPGLAQVLRGCLDSKHEDLRAAAAWGLARVGPSASCARDELDRLARSDPSEEVRRASKRALEVLEERDD